jgi:hypothetical protein
MPKFINLIGQKFNKLVATKYMGQNKFAKSLWLCKCDCGNQKIILGDNLIRKETKSCGCLRIEMAFKKNLKHGHSKRGKHSKTYNIWQSMIQRCTNLKCSNYKNYGGRGIKVSKRWMKFENFLADIGECPINKSLDRIKNNKGYYPKNCKLSTSKEQNRNKRTNVFIKINGTNLCLEDCLKKYDIAKTTFYRSLRKYKKSIEETMKELIKKNECFTI